MESALKMPRSPAAVSRRGPGAGAASSPRRCRVGAGSSFPYRPRPGLPKWRSGCALGETAEFQGSQPWRLNQSIAIVSDIGPFLSREITPNITRGDHHPIVRASTRSACPMELPQIERITERFKVGDYEGCLAILKDVAASHPELPPGRLMFAKLCLMMDQSAKGREALELAAVENPDVPETYIVFGRLGAARQPADRRSPASVRQGDRSGGLGFMERPYEEGLPRRSAYSGLAGVAEKRKDWPAAATSLAAWLKLEPKSGQARGAWPKSCSARVNMREPMASWSRAVSHDPTLEPAAILMGAPLHRGGEPGQGWGMDGVRRPGRPR